jgi:hypothetical protein
MILVVSANQGDAAYMQVFWDESDKWNDQITGLTDYTATNLDVSITGENVLTADIATPSSYMGLDEDERVAYVALATDGPGGGVYRYSDAYVVNFTLWNGNQEGPIYSLAYHDSGKLLAGDYDSSQVLVCPSPTASPTAKFSKVNSLKQPGGTNMVTVGWYGDTAIAATRGDESAFAESTDDGYSWNDISLIDTDWNVINSFAVNADGSKYYLSTTETSEGSTNYDTSIWVKSAGKWRRIYLYRDVADAAAKYLVRTAPEDDAVVYIASVGTQNIWVSKNSGMESWKQVSCYKLSIPGTDDTLVDLAVESADVAYVLGQTVGVSKTTNGGGSWATAKKPVEGMAGYQIIIAPNGDIIVGGSDGYVSYSQDGGSTFKQGPDFGSGNVLVTCDDGYADNLLIYGGESDDVKRAKVTSPAPPSTRFTANQITNEVVTGVVQVENLTYVTTCNGSQSYLYMSRKLETAADTTKAEWSSIASDTSTGPGGTADEAYNQSPNPLRATMSGGTPKLWTIDTTSPALESYTDPTSLSGPTMQSPAADAKIKINPGSGRSYDVTFIYERYSNDAVTQANLEIATDPDFNAKIKDIVTTGIDTDTVAIMIGPYGSSTVLTAEFLPGTTYYWRVRTETPMYSDWSETRSFTIESPETFTISGPALGSGDVSTTPTLSWAPYEGAIKYELALSEFPNFSILDWSANVDNPFYAVGEDDALKYSTTYYWRVRGVTSESPYEAGPWITGVFTTMAAPEPPPEDEPDVITVPGETKIIEVPVVEVRDTPIPTYLLWVIVGVGAVLIIALIVLIVRTRRVA